MGPPLRDALIAGDPVRGIVVGADLAEYKGEPAVFTRRPVPEDAEDPMIIINPPVGIGDFDALNSDRPVWSGTVALYGRKGAPGSSEDQTRLVDALGYRIRELFHRQRFSVRPDGFSVIDVVASGPIAGPVDDDKTVARIVGLRIRLRRE